VTRSHSDRSLLHIDHSDKEEAIAAARTAFARCQFDEGACDLGLRRLRAYRKEWDEVFRTLEA
jgi:hypothetical protein